MSELPKIRRFKSRKKYRKFLAYEHIHGLERKHGPYPETIVAGKKVNPKHVKNRSKGYGMKEGIISSEGVRY